MPSCAAFLPLQGVRVVSLALNLPGPAALLRCAQKGADCIKVEPPPTGGHASADPMGIYSPTAYEALHQGVRVLHAHLKTESGQATLHEVLTRADILLTSFRPSALDKLGLSWTALQARYPRLSLVRIVGALGARAEEPGHDLTYQAEAGLLGPRASPSASSAQAQEPPPVPASLFADMAGALVASEAVLQAILSQRQQGVGRCIEVGLAESAQWLALPLQWGLTTHEGDVGGAHAGYRLYHCADGQVAVAALEPHFAARLCAVAGVTLEDHCGAGSVAAMRQASTHEAIARFLSMQTRAQLTALAQSHDIPLHVL